MTSVLLPLLIAFYIGYQVDENKMKQYEMINESGQIVRVQFSKFNDYSCPLSCGVDHFHYTKTISDEELENSWSVKIVDEKNGDRRYNVNGININTYKIVETTKKRPKNVPMPFGDLSLND